MLTPGELAQVPAPVQTPIVAATSTSQDTELQQLLKPAEDNLSKHVQKASSMPGKKSHCSLHATADAHNDTVPQQHGPAEPQQAAHAVLPESGSRGPRALQSAVDQFSVNQTSAEASAASIPCTDSLKLAQPASLLHGSQRDKFEQSPQPTEPLQVCLLVLPSS